MALCESEVTSTPLDNIDDDDDDDLFYVNGVPFPTMKEAFDHVLNLYFDMLPLFRQTKKDLKHFKMDLEYEQNEKEEMKIKFMEMKATLESYDLTRFDTMEIEFEKTKELRSNVELENSRLEAHKQDSILLISSLNDELFRVDQVSTSHVSNIARLEDEVSSLKKEKDIVSCVPSVSPSYVENVLNDRVKFLECENLKLNNIITSFTRSQSSLDNMIGGLVANSSKHGLGYQINKQTRKPRKPRPLAKFVNNHNTFVNNDYFYTSISKVTCHYCCLKGHVSLDCLAVLVPTKFEWRPKQLTNIVGIVIRLPFDASLAGASSSSNA